MLAEQDAAYDVETKYETGRYESVKASTAEAAVQAGANFEREARYEAERQVSEAETQEAINYRLARRMEREQREYMQGLMEMNEPAGKELGRGDYVVPRSVAHSYTEMDGKFYTKDVKNPRVVFEDQGNKLSTATTDPKAVANMVALAKAKQWDTLKVSGSQEFRREAWLQAESQGIKTSGYTPKEADLAALETLRRERATNIIQPMRERQEERTAQQAAQIKIAPRHDLNKNQAQMHVVGTERLAENIEALKKNPALADRTAEALEKLAYWRGMLHEDFKNHPQAEKEAVLAEFDKAAEDPAIFARLDKSDAPAQELETRVQDKEQRQERKDTYEQSL
jgi:hypothetical protein